jgi:hypothetical protein
MSIAVATIAIANKRTGVCEPGEIGVCYGVYSLSGRPGYSFIFESGRDDGFSPDEVAQMLLVTDHVCARVADYRLSTVGALQHDFRCGRFRDALRCAWA